MIVQVHPIDYDNPTPEDEAELYRQKAAYRRLHEAAPDLLAALKALVGSCSGFDGLTYFRRAPEMQYITQARAAIAKATTEGKL